MDDEARRVRHDIRNAFSSIQLTLYLIEALGYTEETADLLITIENGSDEVCGLMERFEQLKPSPVI